MSVLPWLVLVAVAGPAEAHASLMATTPQDDATVDEVEQVTLEFNEPASAPPGGIRVFDADAERVDVAGTVRNLAPEVVAVDLEPDLPDGSYVVTWRAVSADGHPVRGAFLFSVGDGGDVDDDLIARLFAGEDGLITGALACVARAGAYLGALLAAGALLFALVVARDEREQRRARTWARRGGLVAVVATVLLVPLQAVATTGFGPLQALAPDVLGSTLDSSVGVAALVRLAALAVLMIALVRGWGTAPSLGLATVAVLSFLIDGHTRTTDPAALMFAADATHLLAAAAWFGGLVVLGAALRQRSFDEDPVGAARLVVGYSRIATVSVIAVTLTGSAMSWALVRQLRAFTSTSYGWTLLAKLALATVIIGVGLVNNRRLVPAVARVARVPAGGATDAPTRRHAAASDPEAVTRTAGLGWSYLRRTIRLEAGLMIAVLLVTGSLVNLRPAAEAAGITGAFETTVQVSDELDLNLVIDPNRAGDNQIHLYILDQTGRPASDVEHVLLRFTQPERDIGPIERDTFVAGPGHWQLNGNSLSLPGEWQIEVLVRVDAFTEAAVTVPVVVNPA